MEEWRPINELGITNYEISNEGRVKNSITGKILKTQTSDRGYERVTLHGNDGPKTLGIDRLVAKYFLDKKNESLIVTHINGNRSKNGLSNLTYKSRSEVIKQTYKNGRKQKHRMRRIRCVETGEEWESIEECSKDTGLNKHSICKCVNNKFTKVKDGRHFESVD